MGKGKRANGSLGLRAERGKGKRVDGARFWGKNFGEITIWKAFAKNGELAKSWFPE
jgi:hypothetical protein